MAQAAFNAVANSATANELGMQLFAELAATTPDLKGLQSLIDAGADIEQLNDKQQTPLIFAAYHKKDAGLQLLVQNKADLSARDGNGATAMFHSLARYNNVAVKALLQGGLDPEKDILKGGLTALMWAANLNKYDLATLVAEYGGDPHRKNLEDGQTAIDYASKKPFIQQAMETIYNRKAAEREREKLAATRREAQAAEDAERNSLDKICRAGIPLDHKVKRLTPPKFKKLPNAQA